ncbi:BTB/POZ and MATH domain-containing protein 1-like [Miscanthus floridulus]|uniref:BTB/POZ and MATH domain-containing protein 1-like n=1 Tax=Miscanthus floridulus TaxID=154761 RepID=UPI00345AB851
MAALALSSAARQLSRSASTIFMREVSGSHKLTIDGYSASRKLPQAWWAPSQAFEVAGYSWRILYFPNGRRQEEGDDDCISLYLELVHGGASTTTPRTPIPSSSSSACSIRPGTRCPGTAARKNYAPSGCTHRVRLARLAAGGAEQNSGALKWKDLHEEAEPRSGRPLRYQVRHHVLEGTGRLLWKQKHGADVVIDVAGETFDAHGWLLAARSPVLEAELLALTSSTRRRRRVPPAA